MWRMTLWLCRVDEQTSRQLRLRRVPDLNKSTVDGQGALFTAWRYHAAFADSPYVLVRAEAQHRAHAIIEQVFAELIDGPLAHLPSGRFNADNAWLSCITIAHNTARAATIRQYLINVAGRITRHAREVTLHLPQYWPWQHN